MVTLLGTIAGMVAGAALAGLVLNLLIDLGHLRTDYHANSYVKFLGMVIGGGFGAVVGAVWGGVYTIVGTLRRQSWRPPPWPREPPPGPAEE